MSTLAYVIKMRAVIFCFCAALLITALSLSAYYSGAYAVYFGASSRRIPIYCVDRQDKKISISFDCAWGTDHTDDILSELERNDVIATWFMAEFWTTKYPEFVKKIDEAGHEIGTHSSTHSYMSKLGRAEIESELASSSEAITSITGKKVELFRPPYGDYDDELIDTAESEGYYVIQWDVDSLDWKDLSAGDIALRIINKVKPGSIILMHNDGKHTSEALPMIFSTLKNSGYEFVPIGDLIYRDNYTVDINGCQQPL